MAQEVMHKLTIMRQERGQWAVERVFDLPVGITQVGRTSSSQVQLAHERVSRRHAEFRCTETGCELVDVRSANGTYVGDAKLTPEVPQSLQSGNVIKIDPYQLVYEQTAVVPPTRRDYFVARAPAVVRTSRTNTHRCPI